MQEGWAAEATGDGGGAAREQGSQGGLIWAAASFCQLSGVWKGQQVVRR